MIDVVRYLMGEVSAVQVFGRDLRPHLAGRDTAVYNLRFETGAIGSIQWSFAVAGEPAWMIQLWADEGTLQVSRTGVQLQRPGESVQHFPGHGSSSFVNEFIDFYDVLRTGTQPRMTVSEAVRDLAVIQAAYQSMGSGKVVSLSRTRGSDET
jgi:predicted dehydrogenase